MKRLLAIALVILSCNGVGPSNSDQVESPDITGAWALCRVEAWVMDTVTGGFDSLTYQYHFDTITTIYTYDNATWSGYYNDGFYVPACVTANSHQYEIDGDSVFFDGEFSYRVSLDDDTLYTYTYGSPSPNVMVLALGRYSGTVPPSSWPTNICQ